MSDNTVVTENTVTNIVEVTSAGPAGPPGSQLTIQDQGVSEGLLTDKLNFAGSTVSVNNDTVNEIATVTINAANPGANSNITSMTGVTGGISSPDFIQFDTAAGATGAVGRMLWNDTDGTLEFQMKGGNVTLQVGQEEVLRVTNQSGSAMTDGQVVYITGSTGNHLNVTLSQANSEATSSKTLAVVTEPIANNQSGFATTSGLVRNLNTSALTEGAAIWLSPTVAGGLTSTKPVAPNHAVLIGWCVKQHATVGVIYVHIANGYELEELHNVLITSVANNQVLRYDSATSLWKNATISPTVTLAGAVTGSGTLTDLGNVTITTTATSDPTLTLSGDASGSATFTNLGDATLTVTVADNSHNHIIGNVTGLQTALDSKENTANKGVAGGYASLDGSGTVPTSQLPAAVLGAVKYQGTWNASTNSPALTSSVGTQGYYYVVSVAGSTNLNGITDWVVGDWAIYNGSTWQKIDNTDAVTSVAGRTGAVTLSASDVSGLATVATSGAISDTTGTLAVGRGGTGSISLTSGYLVKGNGTSAVSASVVYDNGTNVGIGTSAPGAKLVVSEAGTGFVSFAPANAATSLVMRLGYNTDYSQITADSFGGNLFIGADESNTKANSYIAFRTDASEKMRIDTSGNVGIGTSSPRAVTNYISLALNGASGSFIDFNTAGTRYGTIFGTSGGLDVSTVSTIPLTFSTNATERLRITSAGNVGIGTSSPSNKLTVSGNMDVISQLGYEYSATALPTINPTLNLDFANSGVLDPRITFTRSSTATYTNSLGLIATAAANVARFDYDPVTLAPKGLLIEEARTNLLTYSSDFTNAAWASTDVTISANALVAPDGTTTAETVTEGSAGTAFISQGVVTTGGTTYTASVFVKRGNTDWLRIVSSDNTNSYTVWVNTATGALGGNGTGGSGVYTSSSITGFGNGWYRVTLTGSNPLALNSIRVNSATANLSNTRVSGATYSLWGAQLEAGAFATSYIPTVASTVTRSADVATMLGTNFSSWYNQNEGTFVSAFDKYSTTTRGLAFCAGSAVATNPTGICVDGQNDGKIRAYIENNGATELSNLTLANYASNTPIKGALAYATNNAVGAAAGALGTVDTSVFVPTMDIFQIGALRNRTVAASDFLNGHIRSIAYYPTRLADSILQGLTS